MLKRTMMLMLVAILALGISAQAAEVDCDSVYCFTPNDFSDQTLQGVCITALPDAQAGTVLLGTRVVRPGDILTADQLSQLTLQPLRTEHDAAVTVTYLPIYENKVEKETTVTISIRGKVDKAPAAEDSALETYKNLPVRGQLKAKDPEGSSLTYTVTRQPKRGEVNIEADGSFTYTPKKNKVGTDSFTYTATDETGHVSRQALVTVQILKPTDKQQYSDTVGNDCRFAAEWMKNTGLFVGEQINGKSCFQPEKLVTRGEFLAMLVQSLGIAVDENATYTGFTDDAPSWLKPYLAAALRAGLTANWQAGDVFGAEQPITGAEAALLMQNALDFPLSTAATENDHPAWAAEAMTALAENGLALPNAAMTRAQVAMALYRMTQIAPTAPGSVY